MLAMVNHRGAISFHSCLSHCLIVVDVVSRTQNPSTVFLALWMRSGESCLFVSPAPQTKPFSIGPDLEMHQRETGLH